MTLIAKTFDQEIDALVSEADYRATLIARATQAVGRMTDSMRQLQERVIYAEQCKASVVTTIKSARLSPTLNDHDSPVQRIAKHLAPESSERVFGAPQGASNSDRGC